MAASMARSFFGFLHQNSAKLLLQPDELLRYSVAMTHAYGWSPRQGPYKNRRTLKPRWFWPRKKAAPTPDLTPGNAEFLQEVVRDTYEDVVTSKSPLKDEPWPRQEWTLLPVTKRAGVIGMKLGTIPHWTKDGKRFFVTLVQVIDNHVIRYHSPEETRRLENSNNRSRSQFGSVVVGALSCDPTRLAKSYVNLFAEAGVPPKRKLAKFYVSPNAAVAPGTPIGINHFRVGDHVDVYSRSVGRGNQGVMKRWGFKGGPDTHGTTKWHRRGGSLSGGDWSRVFPGTKMPGHMGNRPVNMRGLKIWRINTKYNVLYLHGSGIAGPAGAYVKLRDTTLVPYKEKLVDRPPPMPTWYPDDSLEPIPEEVYDDELFNFSDESVVYDEEKS